MKYGLGNEQLIELFSSIIRFLKRKSYAARVIELISNSPLYKGVLILGSGAAVAQLISIAAMPIITRLYTPSNLGVLAVFSSVLAIVGISATLRFELAYVLPQKDEEAIDIFGLCLILLFITTSGLALVLFFKSKLLIDIFDIDIIEQYLWLLLAGFFGMGLYNILNYWAIRQRDYINITYTKVIQGVGGSGCKILLGFLPFGPTGLIIGHIFSQIAGIGTLAHAMRGKRELLREISLRDIIRAAKTYKSFPIFNFPSSIVNTISMQIPPIILLSLYDSQTVGFYALAQMLIGMPGNLISYPMAYAYMGESSKMIRDRSRNLRSLYLRTLMQLSMIAIPLIGIPALCLPSLVPIIFGEAWTKAGWYCLPLALMVIPQFIASPTNQLTSYGYNNWMLIWDVIRFSFVIIPFYLSFSLGISAIMTITIYSFFMLLMYILLVILNLKAINKFTAIIERN